MLYKIKFKNNLKFIIKIINLLRNTDNNDEKIKLSDEIQSDLNDAYLKKKIDKEHYYLLKEMVSEYKKENDRR